MKMDINQIEKDEDIYPRKNVSQKTVDDYVESLKSGEVFPPVEVQKILSLYTVDDLKQFKKGRLKDIAKSLEISIPDKATKNDLKSLILLEFQNGKKICKTIHLDGGHRKQMYLDYNTQLAKVIESGIDLKGFFYKKPFKEMEVTFWKEEILDKEANLKELIFRAVELNTRHGYRLSSSDVKSQLKKLANLPDSLTFVWKDIAKRFGVTSVWVSNCVKSILARKRASRDSKIYRLSLLGLTQQEISSIYEINQSRVAQIISKLNEFNSLIILDFKDNKLVEEICNYYNIDEPLAWAIILEGKTDKERLKLLDIPKKDYDVWVFNERDIRLGLEYNGNIPGQIAINLLVRYTKQGDLVLDPMAGGGSTVDACLVMGRKCRAYDINPLIERKDIIQNDIINNIPEKAYNCDLLFLDPPYYNKVPNISGFESPEDFYKFMETLAKVSQKVLREKGYVALVLSNYLDYDNLTKSIFTFRVANIFESVGLRAVGHFECPLSTQQYTGSDVVYAREHNRDLQISRDCFVFRKC